MHGLTSDSDSMSNFIAGASGGDRMIFPSTGKQILSAFIHFAGVSILSHCLSRRVTIEHLTSVSGFMQLSWPRLLIILVFLDSWLFLFTGGIIVFGAGMELNRTVCSLGIDICIAFYATSKIFIYWFLIEKVFLVWTPGANAKRFKSPVYIGCLVMLSLYSVVVVVIVLGRVSFFRDDGACSIGLQPHASATLVAYDLFINLVLNALFLWPLLRSKFMNPTIKKVASRTLFASVVALTTSTVNMLVLTLMHGKQLGWVCLGACGTDVVFNALVLFWITGGAGSSSIANISSNARPAAERKPAPAPVNVVIPASATYPPPLTPGGRDSKAISPRGGGFDYLPPMPRGNGGDVPSPSNVAFIGQNVDGSLASPTTPPVADRRRLYMEGRSKSKLGSIFNLFSRKGSQVEEHSLQIQITTIREVDMPPNSDSMQATQMTGDEEMQMESGSQSIGIEETKVPSLNGHKEHHNI